MFFKKINMFFCKNLNNGFLCKKIFSAHYFVAVFVAYFVEHKFHKATHTHTY